MKHAFLRPAARFAAALSLAALLCSLCACGEAAQSPPPASPAPAPSSASANESVPENTKERYTMIEITMEDGGVIRLELDSEAAPLTVQNFVDLVNDEFYDGLTFHRIMDGFMIQGGCPDGTGSGGPGHNIKGEFASNGWDNPISHQRGVISMARSGDPDSAGSQFFITNGDATFLDGDYAAFGRVVEGMDVVDELAARPAAMGATGERSVPVDPIVIQTIRVVE